MTRTEIIAALHAWNAILGNNTALLSYLGQGDRFTFTFPSYAASSADLHVYPGIHSGNLIFLVIPSDYDNSAYSGTFDSYTQVCAIQSSGSAPVSTAITSSGAGRITSTDASTRIGAWSSGYTTWVPLQTATTDGIFQAFSIPTYSFEVATSLVSLGLKASGGSLPLADLVVTNRTSSIILYDNVSKTVPPFGPSLSSFYLLSL